MRASVLKRKASTALGFGFRCGFLGLLHLEIIQERLEREFDLDLITTAPSVVYKMTMQNDKVVELHNPADYPDPTLIKNDGRAVDPRDDFCAGRLSGQCAGALHGKAWRAGEPDLCRQPRAGGI
jgi:hypothetical protein